MWVSSSIMGFSMAIEAIAMERVRKHIKKVSFEVKICGFLSEVSEATRATNWIRTVKWYLAPSWENGTLQIKLALKCEF